MWNLVPCFSEKECVFFALTDYILSSNNSKYYEQVYRILKQYFSNEKILALTQAI